MTSSKKIGILTSGGDCSGLNAAIRAVTHCAESVYGWEVIGICRATRGLLNQPPDVMKLTTSQVDNWLTMGGTMLGTTNKGNPFSFPMEDGTRCDRSQEIIDNYHSLGLDALIGIGGDGSLAILHKLAKQGNINFVGIPKTIDNDVSVTEKSIGFESAVNIATEALDRLHFTAASHERVMIVEVMGRDAGHIAINAGIAGGAHVVLIPEIDYDLKMVCDFICDRQNSGNNYTLVVVSEAVCTESGQTLQKELQFGECRLGGIGQYLADKVAAKTGSETRVTVLGHIQRGGTASPLDRLLASAFGVAAVNLIAEEKFDRMVTWEQGQVSSVPISEAIKTYRTVNPEGTLVKTARGLGICLGDRPLSGKVNRLERQLQGMA
ncbi:ATP-dependent 6-phosphofructokinase [[Limnothrix rosea] IAM M-220]|uniref:ATP-dependent 6-phosphofructokinase n=1 Tax=[Limnothrix rosea] IAM M-220 TaxID=454133 RepID=UPI000968D75E|nr:ATP-dependent 6-phosphofructokinase [[Limnothrix rosea] IAM M-220]OKH19268.1 6-phosphofructokinase [[Limnothrix rosea] IAM M-220]